MKRQGPGVGRRGHVANRNPASLRPPIPESSSHREPDGNPTSRLRVLELAVLCAGIFVGAMDQTVAVAALPAIITDLKIQFAQLDRASWIITGYLLGYTAAMPLAGRLADIYGPRRAYLGSLACFTVGSVGCAVAPGLWPLVAARVIQAAGGGALLPAAMASVGQRTLGRAAGTALGTIAAVAEAGGVIGPLYGSLLADRFGWRSIFWSNVPLAAAIVGGMYLAVSRRSSTGGKRDPASSGADQQVGAPASQNPRASIRQPENSSRQIDWLGAVLAGGGLAALTVALSDEARQPRPLAVTAALVVAAALLLLAFGRHERRTPYPLLDLDLFRQSAFSAANLASLVGGGALIVAMVNVPLWGHAIAGQTTLESGLLLMRLTMLIPVGALFGGWVTRRLGARWAAVLGFPLAAAGLALIGQWPLAPAGTVVTRDLAVAGFGFGVLVPALTTTAIAAAGAAHAGAAAALVTVTRMVGMMLGLAAITTWGLRRFDTLVRTITLPVPQIGEAAGLYQERLAAYQSQVAEATQLVFHELFFAAAVMALLGLLPSLWVRERQRPL